MASDGTGASVAVIVVSDRRQSDVFDELDCAAKRSKTMMRVFITPCGKREEVGRRVWWIWKAAKRARISS